MAPSIGDMAPPTTTPRLLMLEATLYVPPRLPRSVGVPSLSQSTACSPAEFRGGSEVFEHKPDEPTAWPLSLIPNRMRRCRYRTVGAAGSHHPAPRSPLQNGKADRACRGAGWIDNAILRKPDYLASIIEIKGAGTCSRSSPAALQSRKRLQGPIFPDGPEALTVCTETAKVLSRRTKEVEVSELTAASPLKLGPLPRCCKLGRLIRSACRGRADGRRHTKGRRVGGRRQLGSKSRPPTLHY